MRILLSCLQRLKRHQIPAHDFWRLYFTKGCEEADIEFVEVPNVDWAEGLTYRPGKELNEWRSRTWEAALASARREHERQPISFFLGYFYPQQIEVAAIEEIQSLGIPCVNFFCDNVREFHRVPKEYHSFALHWVPEYEALPMYRSAGLPHFHAPMPCWVPPELRNTPDAETEPPTFIGSADVLRRDLLGHAMAVEADLVVRGPGWDSNTTNASACVIQGRSFLNRVSNQWSFVQQHGVRGWCHKLGNRLRPLSPPRISDERIQPAVFGAEYFRVTREASITIGVNRVPTARRSDRRPLTYSRLRDLEAPMLGACYLTEWTEGLSQLYELGTEIESFRTSEELCAKITELKQDPARRRNLRARGQRRALVEHAVARSLGRIRENFV